MAATSMQSRGTNYRPELDEAERASRDEIMALQTTRLAWSLKLAYDNVAHYKKACDAAGVHPSEFWQLDTSIRRWAAQRVFMECHPRPEVAKSDGPNAFYLEHVGTFVRQILEFRKLAKSSPKLIAK